MKREIRSEADLVSLSGWEKPASEEADRLDLPTLFSARELFTGSVPEPRAVIENLLWDGLTMLIARPKAGKSWFTLQCAVHVAGGQGLTGIVAVELGPVLYAALEEPKGRTMSRLRKVTSDGPWANNLHFMYEMSPLMGGGAEQLGKLIRSIQPRLVVLDTLSAVVKNASKSGSDVFRSQYAEVARIRKLAEEFRTAIIVVHHTRKGLSESAIEAVAGTGGIAAAVDSVWQLKKKPAGEATLEIVGRDSEERLLALRFGDAPFGWQVLGDDDDQVLNAERRELLSLLNEDGGMTPAQIASELGKTRPSVRMLLKRMKDDNLVYKQGQKYIPTLTKSYRVTERE